MAFRCAPFPLECALDDHLKLSAQRVVAIALRLACCSLPTPLVRLVSRCSILFNGLDWWLERYSFEMRCKLPFERAIEIITPPTMSPERAITLPSLRLTFTIPGSRQPTPFMMPFRLWSTPAPESWLYNYAGFSARALVPFSRYIDPTSHTAFGF